MENSKDQAYYENFTKPIIKTGKWTLLLAVAFCFLPAIYLWIRYGALPPVKSIITGWFLIASIYGSYYFIEPISFFPVLGMAGTYMSFLAGNIGNMRVPCAAVAQEALKVEPGSKKAELVATLGIAGSIITNIVIVTIAAIAGNGLMQLFPPVVVKAFEFVLPAIFGSMFAMFAVKYPKYGAFAIGLTLFLLGVVKVLPVYVLIPLCVFSTIIFATTSYKKKTK
ncbi:hypothetical protein KQI38_02330 [Tissierella carlieri]|uniref:Small-conductance mechanosensitive channel n=1 Tax=Tissierella carlieri TaxID=689904 RepID=A0ABT1SCF1_9FIRM|nr:hypothetical protein [Tissierella carlieri]MBU5310855.1 hypothetical protein [Tissierella carlieri]MCQ4924159.1 hypothetical protein [Tissierella carlieri]